MLSGELSVPLDLSSSISTVSITLSRRYHMQTISPMTSRLLDSHLDDLPKIICPPPYNYGTLLGIQIKYTSVCIIKKKQVIPVARGQRQRGIDSSGENDKGEKAVC